LLNSVVIDVKVNPLVIMHEEASPKWSPYGVALSMALMGRCFEEAHPRGVVKKPRSCLKKKSMKDIANA
jgi:hypothetical protein